MQIVGPFGSKSRFKKILYRYPIFIAPFMGKELHLLNCTGTFGKNLLLSMVLFMNYLFFCAFSPDVYHYSRITMLVTEVFELNSRLE